MMSDKEKLFQLLEGWGIKREEHKDKDGYTKVFVLQEGPDGVRQEKVTGYVDFFTSYKFTESGEFVSMGAWE